MAATTTRTVAAVAGSRGKFLSHVTLPRSTRAAAGTDDDGDGASLGPSSLLLAAAVE